MLNIIFTQRRGNSSGRSPAKTTKTNKTNILAAVHTWLAVCLLAAVTACANSPNSKALEESLAADPKLKQNPVVFSSPPPATAASRPAPARRPGLLWAFRLLGAALKYGSVFEIRPAADLTELMKASEQRRRQSTAR